MGKDQNSLHSKFLPKRRSFLVDELYQRFEDDTKIYMTYEKASEVKKSGEPIIWWQKYYFNYDQINRRTFFGKFYHRALLLGQTLFRVDKFKKLNIDLELTRYHMNI